MTVNTLINQFNGFIKQDNWGEAQNCLPLRVSSGWMTRRKPRESLLSKDDKVSALITRAEPDPFDGSRRLRIPVPDSQKIIPLTVVSRTTNWRSIAGKGKDLEWAAALIPGPHPETDSSETFTAGRLTSAPPAPPAPPDAPRCRSPNQQCGEQKVSNYWRCRRNAPMDMTTMPGLPGCRDERLPAPLPACQSTLLVTAVGDSTHSTTTTATIVVVIGVVVVRVVIPVHIARK